MASGFKGKAKIPSIWNKFKGAILYGMGRNNVAHYCQGNEALPGHIHILNETGHTNRTWEKTLLEGIDKNYLN